MNYTVENYCGLIMRSKLLAPEVVHSLCQGWRQSATDPRDTKDFARWLVAHQHLTEYQASLLLHGYADNFFLGPYKILERIGKGRMAGVYRAVHVETGQVVALKVLPPSAAKDDVCLKRFLREADIARELVHPNIVRTFHAGRHHGLYFLVMEYLEGVTLEEILKQRTTLTPLETARLGFFVCQALQYLYEKQIVHRDIEPGNIILLPAPQPQELTLRSAIKLLDVGLARDIFSPNREPQHPALTSESAILGSLDYLAPEQARDARRVDIRADLYSLGCVLYHCLAGQPPFVDTNPARQLARHASESPRPLPEINPQVSPAFWNIIARLLAKNPDQRYNTPGDAAQALKTLLQETPHAPSPQPSRDLQAYLGWLQQRPHSAASPVVPAPRSSQPPVRPQPPLKKLRRRRIAHSRVERLTPKPEKGATLSPPAAAQPQVSASSASPAPAQPASRAEEGIASVPAATVLPADQSLPARVASAPNASHSIKPEQSPAATSFLTLINVEPVSAADLLKAPFGLPIPRDLFMFLLGALSVLLLVGFIWLIVWLASPW